MNQATRTRLSAIISALEDLRNEVGEIQSEEQDKFDNLPESLQQGEQGQKMEEAASALSDCESNFDDIIAALETASE